MNTRHTTLAAFALSLGVLWAAMPTGAQTQTAPAAIPRTAEGKPDFSGIWQALNGPDFDLEAHHGRKDAPPFPGVVEGGSIPYKPEALARKQQNFAKRDALDPRLKCYALGTPRGVYYPEPFQIFQRPRDLTIVFQFGHPVRTINTNGTRHPKGPIGFWYGDSRATWEGDTLVVDVADFVGETWHDRAGNFTTDQLHVVERWTLVDANTIAYKATLTDPNIYTRPWSLNVLLHRHREPNFQIIENYCSTLEYEQSYPYPKE